MDSHFRILAGKYEEFKEGVDPLLISLRKIILKAT